MMTLPPELCRMRDELRGYAVEYGLDFFEVLFEMLDWRQINEVAAFGGFPNRYPHWRFGMEYEQLAKSYTYGLSKIYEMVINNDPCYAYLLHSNNLVDQKLVMAHVYAHSDFFKNNIYFAHTNRKMMDEMANHRTRVMRYIDRIGYDKVESFIDACLSLETLIDYHGVAIRRAPARPHIAVEREGEEDGPVVRKLGTGARKYMERYLNPPEFLEAQQKKLEEERQREKNFPERPQRDVLQFLTDYAPLDGWERDLLSIVREEAVYFSPQAQTKIMNEGWACVTGETRILTDRGALPAREIVTGRLPVRVCDGAAWRRVTDWAHFPSRTTVRVQTRRGFVLEGSATHQVLTEASPDTWRRLDELRTNECVRTGWGSCENSVASDEIVSIETAVQDVYDFTVEQTHRYVAHGFVNHNSYWHSKIMTQRALKDSEVIDYADHHAGVVAMTPQRINPYKVGIELYRDIEDRWNRGRFGKEYEECTDMRVRAKWDRQLGLGRQKIFEVRKIYNDITFLDEFLTPEFCREHRMFVYSYNLSSDQYEIADRTFEKIKKQLLNQLTNAGQPTIDVVDANYGNRGELLLKHQHDGVDLRYDYAQETLKNLFRIWRRPVNIETVVEGVPKILSYDGQAPKEFRP